MNGEKNGKRINKNRIWKFEGEYLDDMENGNGEEYFHYDMQNPTESKQFSSNDLIIYK